MGVKTIRKCDCRHVPSVALLISVTHLHTHIQIFMYIGFPVCRQTYIHIEIFNPQTFMHNYTQLTQRSDDTTACLDTYMRGPFMAGCTYTHTHSRNQLVKPNYLIFLYTRQIFGKYALLHAIRSLYAQCTSTYAYCRVCIASRMTIY